MYRKINNSTNMLYSHAKNLWRAKFHIELLKNATCEKMAFSKLTLSPRLCNLHKDYFSRAPFPGTVRCENISHDLLLQQHHHICWHLLHNRHFCFPFAALNGILIVIASTILRQNKCYEAAPVYPVDEQVIHVACTHQVCTTILRRGNFHSRVVIILKQI